MRRHINSIIQTVDPITFEIIAHRLNEITKEMGATLERVGGTVNTTQLKDYMAALYLANGDILSVGASSTSSHVACAGVAVKSILERFGKEGDIYPDDMFLVNDPYVAAIHQSDMYMISPIHFQEKLIGWSATFVHVMDIGALSPGGNSPEATEICHEGVRIPGIKLMERGRIRKDVFDTIINMTRQPVMVGLDLKCEIASNNVARARMQAMAEKYGVDLIAAVSSKMISYTESVLKKRIKELPDGSWSDTALIQTEDAWKVKLTLQKTDDYLVFDFTGTDKQARRGINLPYHATFGICFQAVVSTLGYDIPKNSGGFSPIRVVAPEGSVVNVKYPGPVSLNTTSGMSIAKYLAFSVLMQAIATSKKWQKEVMAQTLAGRFFRHAGMNQYHRFYVSTLLEAGSSGAASHHDGINSSTTGMSCHNIEWVELNFPLLYLFRRHIMDGAGAGKLRGGEGVEIAITLHDATEGKIKGIALGVAGLRNGGQGLFGGYPGAPSLLVLFEGTRIDDFMNMNNAPIDISALGGKARLLPYCEFDLNKTDVLFLRGVNGGGFGDPLERDPHLVLSDVRNGLISRRSARHIYGVSFHKQGAVLDLEATKKLRSKLINDRVREPGKGFMNRRLKPSPEIAIPGNNSIIPEGTRQPLRENLEVCKDKDGDRVRCIKCLYILCRVGEDWKKACGLRHLIPTKAGPLMKELKGSFLLEQLFCPSCGILLDTQVVEERNDGNRKFIYN